jgi:hypothetical protein
MAGKAADALQLTQIASDLGVLRQDVERLRRTLRESQRQDALSESTAWAVACSTGLNLPGLTGSWTMSAFDDAGATQDFSENGLTLTMAGDPEYGYDGLAPYVALDGTGDWLARATAAILNISGTEMHVEAAYRGLSMGGWFRFANAAGANETMMGKWLIAGNQRSYMLRRDAAGTVTAFVSVDGAALTQATSTATPAQNTWFFAWMVFDPSNELSVFVDSEKSSLLVGVPASIFASTADFRIGANGGGTALMTGRASHCSLCAEFHSDALVEGHHAKMRGLYRRL